MTITEEMLSQLNCHFAVLLPHLNERQRRLAVAAEARLLGHGGVRAAARTATVSETTVRRGITELEAGTGPLPGGRIRAEGGGGGRKPAEELTRQGHPVSAPTVGRLLKQAGFSLRANAKTLEGGQHPDRNAQFRYLNKQVKQHQAAGDPMISVDTKKREQIGRLPMPGREWRPKGNPVQVEDCRRTRERTSEYADTRPRNERRNSVQNASVSLSPTMTPRTSRPPSSVTPVAMTTAWETIW
nr:hypothetical protein [Streptomyces sp. NWU339]